MIYPISYMLEMPTIDQTHEWEESLNSEEGDVKFPVSFLDRFNEEDIKVEASNIDIGTPRLKKSSVKEIKLGKKTKNKGNELF